MNVKREAMASSDDRVHITDLVLRDAHQSLLATRMRTEDMLPITEKLNRAGYWSLEMWGGATFDSMMRYLNEDPWERVRALRAALPDTRLQMLLRGQNVVGYRNYADDVVAEFVRLSARAGIDVFRVFDALNDPRNMEAAIAAVRDNGKWVEATISYTKSPVHNVASFLTYAGDLAAMGAQSFCIKDMAGLLDPSDAYELVSALKRKYPDILVHMHCHYTSGHGLHVLSEGGGGRRGRSRLCHLIHVDGHIPSSHRSHGGGSCRYFPGDGHGHRAAQGDLRVFPGRAQEIRSV